VFVIPHTILATAISCKGQGALLRTDDDDDLLTHTGYWPLQDIGYFEAVVRRARINHPFIRPAHLHRQPWCNTIAR